MTAQVLAIDSFYNFCLLWINDKVSIFVLGVAQEPIVVSLESFFEETELEFEDPDANQCEAILTAMLFEDLLEKLHQQAPDFASIFEMLYDGKSQYAIAELIGKPQTTVNYMIKRMRTILQQHVSREDLGI